MGEGERNYFSKASRASAGPSFLAHKKATRASEMAVIIRMKCRNGSTAQHRRSIYEHSNECSEETFILIQEVLRKLRISCGLWHQNRGRELIQIKLLGCPKILMLVFSQELSRKLEFNPRSRRTLRFKSGFNVSVETT